MNKYIAQVICLLFVLMLATALSIVWLKCFYLSVFGGIGVIITLLVLHDIYEIRARQRRRYNAIWKQIAHRQREMQLKSDELFLTYDYSTRDWR